MVETILDYDGGWLKLFDSEAQYLKIADGQRQYAAKLPPLDVNHMGLWIITAQTAAVRCGVSASSYKVGARKRGETIHAEGSLNARGLWLRLAAGQYLLASHEAEAWAEQLPALNRTTAGKWIVTCPPPSIAQLSLWGGSPVRCGPSGGCEQVAARRFGEVVEAEGTLDAGGGWLKLAAASDQYMRLADAGGRALLSRLPDLDRGDAGAWAVCAGGGGAQRATAGLCGECRALDAFRRGEIARAEGSLRFDGGTWIKLAAAGAPDQYALATDRAGAALWARLPPADAADAGAWTVSSPGAHPVWLGLGGESRRAGARRQGEVVRADGSVTVAALGGTWLRLAGTGQYVLLAPDGSGARRLVRRGAD